MQAQHDKPHHVRPFKRQSSRHWCLFCEVSLRMREALETAFQRLTGCALALPKLCTSGTVVAHRQGHPPWCAWRMWPRNAGARWLRLPGLHRCAALTARDDSMGIGGGVARTLAKRGGGRIVNWTSGMSHLPGCQVPAKETGRVVSPPVVVVKEGEAWVIVGMRKRRMVWGKRPERSMLRESVARVASRCACGRSRRWAVPRWVYPSFVGPTRRIIARAV